MTTQDEIIEMARQAGMDYIQYISEDSMRKVQAFVKLVAAKERERLADIAQKNGNDILAMQLRGEA